MRATEFFIPTEHTEHTENTLATESIENTAQRSHNQIKDKKKLHGEPQRKKERATEKRI